MRLTAIAILFGVAFGPSVAGDQEPSRPGETVKADSTAGSSLDRVDAYVQGVMLKRHVPGVSIAIVQDGKILAAKAYGQANVELAVPATEKTVYQLASVTKTFTATAIMMLVQDGKLGLDDKITAHLADMPAAWKEVRVRHLLSHTSGIKSYTSVRDFHKTARKDYTQREIIDLVAKEPLEFAPGEKWSYCNTGYFLLGMLIEKVTGKKYGEFLDERIFKPLGMTQTRVNDLQAVIPHRAQGYTWNGHELRNGEYVSPTQPFAAGMLASTAGDLVKWDAALRTESLLKRSSLEQMWTPTKLNNGTEANYGFGWELTKVSGHRLCSHGGGIPGFATYLARFVDDNLTVIVLTNAGNGSAAALARGIAGRLVPDLAENARGPIADTDAPTTERLKRVVEEAMKGKADPGLFSAVAQKELVPRITESKGAFASFGALKHFQLFERKESDQKLKLRYRAEFEHESLDALFDLDAAGKIEGLGLRPAD